MVVILLLGGLFFAGAVVVSRLQGNARIYGTIAAVVALVLICLGIGFWAIRAAQKAVNAPDRPRGISGELPGADGISKGAITQAFGNMPSRVRSSRLCLSAEAAALALALDHAAASHGYLIKVC